MGRGGVRSAAAHLPFERWTRFVLGRRSLVVAAWFLVLVGGAVASTSLPARLVSSFSVPGTESDRAAAALERGFGERPEGAFTVLFRVRDASPAAVEALRARLVRAARVVPGGRIGSFRAGPGVVYGEIETALGLQTAKRFTSPLRRALRAEGAPAVLVTGQPAIQHDLEPQLASDLRRGEALALPIALLALTLVLGASLAVAFPFVFAACTIGGSVVLLYVCSRFAAITPFALNLVELIGLGLAIDYSLVILSRFREELARGGRRDDAIVRTMATAGRAVVFSGFAVAIGLALLLFLPVPFVRTMGLAGLLVPLVSIVGALTLQPALLSVWPIRAQARSAAWPWAHRIVRAPRRVLAIATVALLAAAAPVLFVELTPGTLSGLPQSLEASRGLSELRHAFGPGAVTPTDVVVDTHVTGGARRPDVRAAVVRLSNRLFRDPEVYVVALGRRAPYVSADGRYARVRIVGRHEFGAAASRRLVQRVRDTHVPAAAFPHGATIAVGGAAPQGVDFLTRTYAFFPWIAFAALVLTYLVLMRAFQSLLLPLKAVVLNLLSAAAAFGLLALVFDSVEGWVPIFLFATLFGLSMDYEMFLVSRMREAWNERQNTSGAIVVGLERTGRLITAAALVMAASFAGFIVGSVPGLQQFGVGLVFGVLIDATIVRGLMVPSLMMLMGRWSWWLPRRLATKQALLVAAVVAVGLAAPATAAASPTIRLAIAHVVQHCHVWRTPSKLLGASTRLTVKPGTRVVIRADCPMDFDYVQTSGPKLALGNRRTFAGESRVIVFRKRGVYRVKAANVQTPEERGLVTLGETNTLTLTVVVK
jgi:RND superfamily putative drug exporter